MNDLNPVHLPPGSVHSKGIIAVSPDTGATENITFRGNSSTTRLENESDVLKARSISQTSFDNTDGFLDQTENRGARTEVDLLNIQLKRGSTLTDKQINTAEGFDACNVKQHFREGKLDNMGDGKEMHVTVEDARSGESSKSSEKSSSHGPVDANPCTSSYAVEGHQDSSGSTRKQTDKGIKIHEYKRRLSTELDMEEIEERRLRETQRLQDEGQNSKNDTISRESSPNVDGKR